MAILAALTGAIIGLEILGGFVVWATWDRGRELTVAAPELTRDGMMTVLLEEGQADGFTQRWRGGRPLQEAWSGRPQGCRDALALVDVPAPDDDMVLVAMFDREGDGTRLRHRLSRVHVDGASLADTVDVYREACAGSQELEGPFGQTWTAEITAEVGGSPGEEAMVVRSSYVSEDGRTQERVELVWARGGLVSELQLSGPDVVDEVLLSGLVDDVDSRIAQGLS